MNKILIIDHYDSFTYNVADLFSGYGSVIVKKYDQIKETNLKNINTVVFSPGPGHPRDYQASINIYKKIKNKKKIIGICLGFQLIAYAEGGEIIKQKKIFHGYQEKVSTYPPSIFYKKFKQFQSGRYHSLVLKEPFNVDNFFMSMRCSKTSIPMGIENLDRNIFGFQFHPDSFLTQDGKKLIRTLIQH